MDAEQLRRLEGKQSVQIIEILTDFNKKNADLLTFDTFHTDNQWHDLWLAIFAILDDASLASLHTICLNTVRILTRDEFSLKTNYIEQELNTLLALARIDGTTCDEIPATPEEQQHNDDDAGTSTSTSTTTTTTTTSNTNTTTTTGTTTNQTTDVTTTTTSSSCSSSSSSSDVIAEALKCICNLVYQSGDCRRQCLRKHCIDAILKRVASSMRHPSALEYYDMKLLFLLTAYESEARNRLQIDLNGVTYMTKWLDDKLAEPSYSDEQLNIIVELLKVVFNVLSEPDKSPHECEIQNLHLTGILRELLLRFGGLTLLERERERERAVVRHTINLLTIISENCLTELTQKCTHADQSAEQSTTTTTTTAAAAAAAVCLSSCSSGSICFEGRNLKCLSIMLDYLRQSLGQQQQQQQQQELNTPADELISPVLMVLLKCARSDRTMRHFLRKEILPPLRDVSQRPEVGNELRNHLCRFLTIPAMIVRELSADLLFVLCKENVTRMIKYTGYGNAAGLFARRGILDGRSNNQTGYYSSDSEDSDTEEYKMQQQDINPVLGYFDKPNKSNALAEMSDEQKEFEAMQLVSLIDKLHKGGIVQPCRIGSDGKPQPVDNILQLQEELPQQQLDQKRKT